MHLAKAFKEWVEEHSKEIGLFYLPSYSPDLNPDEYLNNDLTNGLSRGARAAERGGFAAWLFRRSEASRSNPLVSYSTSKQNLFNMPEGQLHV